MKIFEVFVIDGLLRAQRGDEPVHAAEIAQKFLGAHGAALQNICSGKSQPDLWAGALMQIKSVDFADEGERAIRSAWPASMAQAPQAMPLRLLPAPALGTQIASAKSRAESWLCRLLDKRFGSARSTRRSRGGRGG